MSAGELNQSQCCRFPQLPTANQTTHLDLRLQASQSEIAASNPMKFGDPTRQELRHG
jgi:hypothetical protein